MRKFLRETWQLWYWAYFCPSKLQRRMNKWVPAEEGRHRADTSYRDILLWRTNRRFLAQFWLLQLFFSSPLIFLTVFTSQPLEWWVVIAILLMAYLLSIFSFLSFAFHLPVIFTLVYLAYTPLFDQGLNKILLWVAAWLIGSSFASIPRQKWGIGTTIILALLAVQQQSWFALLLIPLLLIGYYRLLPDYFVLSLMTLWRTMRLSNVSAKRLLYWLHSLPPHNHELLWLPLLGHDHILAAAFRADAQVTLQTLQQMRTSSHPGLHRTVLRALPQIVTDQLLAATSINELISTARPEHPILPLLVPLLYLSKVQNLSIKALTKLTTSAPVDIQTATMLPRLQRMAGDVSAALEGGNSYLRERGLQSTLNKLVHLQAQLQGMNFDASGIARWQTVVAHWQILIQRELEQQQAASQGKVLNPFQCGNPLRIERAYLFKGRQQFADSILRQVLNRARPTLVLHGPRRCGKSSFLYNLPYLLPKDIISVYIDLQSAASISSEANFFYGLVRAMGRDMRSQGVTAPTANRREFRSEPYAALEDWLDEAEQALESRRILFCFDEFEKLGSAIKEGKIRLTLFDHLRHLIENRHELSFLFCGVQTLAELGPNWSSYFISIEPVEMLYLQQNEARELLEDPDPEFNLGYDTGIVDEVLRVTRCQPYLVQLIGEAMVKQANLHQTRLITPELLEAALESALTAGEPYFTNLWSEYTGEFDKPDEVAAGQRVLHALAHGQALPPTDDMDAATRAAIRRMVRYHVIEQDEAGAYRFEVPFVARWVKERAVLG